MFQLGLCAIAYTKILQIVEREFHQHNHPPTPTMHATTYIESKQLMQTTMKEFV
jgi:hypothetical protein